MYSRYRVYLIIDVLVNVYCVSVKFELYNTKNGPSIFIIIYYINYTVNN